MDSLKDLEMENGLREEKRAAKKVFFKEDAIMLTKAITELVINLDNPETFEERRDELSRVIYRLLCDHSVIKVTLF